MSSNDTDIADMLAKALSEVHSSENISEEGERGRQKTSDVSKELLEREEERDDVINSPFTLGEMKRSISKSGLNCLTTMLDHIYRYRLFYISIIKFVRKGNYQELKKKKQL